MTSSFNSTLIKAFPGQHNQAKTPFLNSFFQIQGIFYIDQKTQLTGNCIFFADQQSSQFRRAERKKDGHRASEKMQSPRTQVGQC
jgi:hypothetical protein